MRNRQGNLCTCVCGVRVRVFYKVITLIRLGSKFLLDNDGPHFLR
jgi:hypothetical protein